MYEKMFYVWGADQATEIDLLTSGLRVAAMARQFHREIWYARPECTIKVNCFLRVKYGNTSRSFCGTPGRCWKLSEALAIGTARSLDE